MGSFESLTEICNAGTPMISSTACTGFSGPTGFAKRHRLHDPVAIGSRAARDRGGQGRLTRRLVARTSNANRSLLLSCAVRLSPNRPAGRSSFPPSVALMNVTSGGNDARTVTRPIGTSPLFRTTSCQVTSSPMYPLLCRACQRQLGVFDFNDRILRRCGQIAIGNGGRLKLMLADPLRHHGQRDGLGLPRRKGGNSLLDRTQLVGNLQPLWQLSLKNDGAGSPITRCW